MGYALGVDLGTTYTAAATFVDGRVDIASLGNRSAAIPSVVLLREDEEILTGEAANRRGATEPGRVAREFKRRVGDTTPLFLGGAPYSAEQLMARLLGWVTNEVASLQGGPADHLAISHPANWGPYKKDLLAQAVRLADLPDATYLTEPEAAAIHYASQSRVETGEIIAVYDLGGGTFDAAVLRKTSSGFEILGEPEGVERLGGIDFDAAVFAHVARSLDGKLEELDEDDQNVLASVARLRQECVDAKEALSTDTDASIPVLLPNVQTEVRLTRSEFEGMIRPALGDSIAAMRRALRSAEVEPDGVSSVLLVGGSSRIPLVAQMVGAELGRPVAVDAHPKHAIALGAALAAAQAGGMAGAAEDVPEDAGTDDIAGAAAAGAGVGAAAGAAVGAAGASEILSGADAGAAAPAAAVPPAEPTPVAGTAPTAAQPVASTQPLHVEVPAQPEPVAAPAAAGAGTPPPTESKADKGVPAGLIYGGILLIVLLVAGGAYLLLSGGDDEPSAVATDVATDETVAPDDTTVTTDPPTTEAPGATVTSCSSGPCITGATVDGGTITIAWEGNGTEIAADVNQAGTFHAHFLVDGQQRGNNESDPSRTGGWDAVGSGSQPYTGDKITEAQSSGVNVVCVVRAVGAVHDFEEGSGNCVDLSGLVEQAALSTDEPITIELASATDDDASFCHLTAV